MRSLRLKLIGEAQRNAARFHRYAITSLIADITMVGIFGPVLSYVLWGCVLLISHPHGKTLLVKMALGALGIIVGACATYALVALVLIEGVTDFIWSCKMLRKGFK